MSGDSQSNTAQNTNHAGNGNNFNDIKNKAHEISAEKEKNRKEIIDNLQNRYTQELNAYNQKLQKRVADLKHTEQEIRDMRVELMSQNAYIDDYGKFLISKDNELSKEEQKLKADILNDTAKEYKIPSSDPTIIRKAANSLDRYYDFVAYRFGVDKQLKSKGLKWDPNDAKQLIKSSDLSTWNMDQLEDLYKNGLVKIPRHKTTYGAIENAFREEHLANLLQGFFKQVNNLTSIRKEYASFMNDEEKFKNFSPEKSTEAKEQLSEFIKGVEKIEDGITSLLNGKQFANKAELYKYMLNEPKMNNFLKSYTTPDETSKMTEIDKILNSFVTFTLDMNQVSPDSGKITIPDEEKDALNGIQRFNQTVMQLADSYESRFEGDLYVPQLTEEERKAQNVHFIDARGFNLTSGDPKVHLEFADRKNVPLFAGEPKADDVAQGHLGDCYLLAVFSAIANQDPDAIKNMMKDNGDSVTVRFFNENREPVYVTVDKTVPVNKGTRKDIYSKKSLWVQMLEKAYVCSGLHQGKTKSIEEGLIKDLAYTDIESGNTEELSKQLFGKSTLPELDFYKELKLDNEFSIEELSKGLRKIDEENAKYIKDMLADGMIVTASADHKENEDLETDMGITYKQADIIGSHAYEVTDVENVNGRYYVTVRNPHAKEGMTVDDDGNTHFRGGEEAGGYSRFTYDEFKKVFTSVDICKYDLTLRDRQKLPEAYKLINTYGYAVEKIAKTLDENDNTFLQIFRNSDKFDNFHSSADRLLDEMKKDVPDPGKIQKELQTFSRAAKEYYTYCRDEKRVDPAKAEGRTLARYKMAKIADELGNVFERNSAKESTLDWDEFSYKAYDASLHIPLTAYEQFGIAEADADKFAEDLADFTKSEKDARMSSYGDILRFLKDGYRSFDPVLEGKQKGSDLMEFYKKNDKDLMLMAAVCRNSEKIAETMEKDGLLKSEEMGKAEFLTLCEKIKPLYEGVKIKTDFSEYKMERPLPELAKITGTPREEYRKEGYGYAQELKNLARSIKDAKLVLNDVSKEGVKALQKFSPEDVKVKEEEKKEEIQKDEAKNAFERSAI